VDSMAALADTFPPTSTRLMRPPAVIVEAPSMSPAMITDRGFPCLRSPPGQVSGQRQGAARPVLDVHHADSVRAWKVSAEPMRVRLTGPATSPARRRFLNSFPVILLAPPCTKSRRW